MIGPSAITITKLSDQTRFEAVCYLSGMQADGAGWGKYFQVQFGLLNGSVSDPVEASDWMVYKERDILKHYYGERGYNAIRIAVEHIFAGRMYTQAVPIDEVLKGVVK